jgi:hypothetical protein
MAAHTISVTEDFLRISVTEDFLRVQFNEAIEEHPHIGPVAKAILDVLLTETTSHVGQDDYEGVGSPTQIATSSSSS